MLNTRMGVVDAQFADIVWENAPLTTRELVNLCEEKLNWQRTTTYTVLKKMCVRGLFKMENRRVTVCISKDEFNAIQSEQLVDKAFGGHLPAFIAAFATRKEISQEELAETREMIDNYGKQ